MVGQVPWLHGRGIPECRSEDSAVCSWGSREPLKVLFAVIKAAWRTMNLAVMRKLYGNEDRGGGGDDGLWSR